MAKATSHSPDQEPVGSPFSEEGSSSHNDPVDSLEPFFNNGDVRFVLSVVKNILDKNNINNDFGMRVVKIVNFCLNDTLNENDPLKPFASFIPENIRQWHQQNASSIRRLTLEDPGSPRTDRYYMEKEIEELESSRIVGNMTMVRSLMPYAPEVNEASICLRLLIAKAKSDYIDQQAIDKQAKLV